MIPNPSTIEGQDGQPGAEQDPREADPGRGGSGTQGAGGSGGASGGHPENFGQRATCDCVSLSGNAHRTDCPAAPHNQKNVPENLPEKFVHGEIELAGVTGLAIKVLQKKRAKKLRHGVDWDLVRLRVAYSQEGLAAILAAVTGKGPVNGEIAGIPLKVLEERTRIGHCVAALPITPLKKRGPDVQTKEGAKGAPAKASVEVIGTVRRFFPNPFIIEVEIAIPGTATPRLAMVRVKSAKNFRRGMEVPLRLDVKSGRYELTRRLPRFPGKW